MKIPATKPGLPRDRGLHRARQEHQRHADLLARSATARSSRRTCAASSGSSPAAATRRRSHSVASFFVSRVDTEADKRLEAIGAKQALELRGKLAVANAKLAYEHFREAFSGPRWEYLAGKGANTQRCLWASTSTKNPDYRDVIYVEELIGPRHGEHDAARDDPRLPGSRRGARRHRRGGRRRRRTSCSSELAEVGVDYDDVTETLEPEGVQKFADSFAELLDGVRAEARSSSAA